MCFNCIYIKFIIIIKKNYVYIILNLKKHKFFYYLISNNIKF